MSPAAAAAHPRNHRYAFPIIWGTIFFLQGVASVVPWFDCPKATRPMVLSVVWWWLAGWAAENLWSVFQFLMQVGCQPSWPGDCTLLDCIRKRMLVISRLGTSAVLNSNSLRHLHL
jgi:hypothetical protein